MNILVIGGTRFFGIQMVEELVNRGHDVTIATRGITPDHFGNKVKRIIFNRSDCDSIRKAFAHKHYDVVIDKIAYCSNDIKNILEVLDCDRYIYMSTTAVYNPKTLNTVEEDYDGRGKELVWCDRGDFSYSDIKRQAEIALSKVYQNVNWTAVRYPVVLGMDDYTNRLRFYVDHIIKGVPMNIDNADLQMGYISSDEAGKFLAFITENDFSGAVNGSSHGTISLAEIMEYVNQKTGCKGIITPDGENAPFNGECEYSINTDKAEKMGFKFSNLKDWIFELLDYYIEQIV
ncbi:MAG: NAD-dependent epimerase/dehydratase family protein [Oscillospiraceae bacterium]|nr:NAD-dependent epimerase/dehydratase family protein [Oscillospiraceae bacterium]